MCFWFKEQSLLVFWKAGRVKPWRGKKWSFRASVTAGIGIGDKGGFALHLSHHSLYGFFLNNTLIPYGLPLQMMPLFLPILKYNFFYKTFLWV